MQDKYTERSACDLAMLSRIQGHIYKMLKTNGLCSMPPFSIRTKYWVETGRCHFSARTRLPFTSFSRLRESCTTFWADNKSERYSGRDARKLFTIRRRIRSLKGACHVSYFHPCTDPTIALGSGVKSNRWTVREMFPLPPHPYLLNRRIFAYHTHSKNRREYE